MIPTLTAVPTWLCRWVMRRATWWCTTGGDERNPRVVVCVHGPRATDVISMSWHLG